LLQRRRLILDTPFSKIRSASMGTVEVSGLAVGPYTMVAPITTRPCYYYRTLVWEWKQQGKNKNWVKVAGESMHVPFFVDDNTGRVLIDPRGADLDIHRDFEQEFNNSFFSSQHDAPGNVNAFLARHGVATSNKIKVEEFCIKPKNSLFILGTLTDNDGIEVTPDPIQDSEPINSFTSQGFLLNFSFKRGSDEDLTETAINPYVARSKTHKVVRLTATSPAASSLEMSQQGKIAAALMKAGISNPAAWSAAGVSTVGTTTSGVQVIADPEASNGNIHSDAVSSSPQVSGFDLRPPVVLKKGTNNKTFLISWRSQQDVARSLGWKCTLMIWGGPILSLISLYVFLNVWNLL